MKKYGGLQVLVVLAAVFTMQARSESTCPFAAPGLPGRDGLQGPPGIPGESGESGRDGRDGRDSCDCAGLKEGSAILNETELQSIKCAATSFSKFMTPTWILNNANFLNSSVVNSSDTKRLTLRNILHYGLLLTIPLSFDSCPRGEDVFKITVSIQAPSGDSDLAIGIGNVGGPVATAQIHDNDNLPRAQVLYNRMPPNAQGQYGFVPADISGSSSITAPFDEEVTFLYKPAEDWGAFYSGTGVTTGVFPHRPNMTDDIHLMLLGENANELYQLQYIHVEIASS